MYLPTIIDHFRPYCRVDTQAKKTQPRIAICTHYVCNSCSNGSPFVPNCMNIVTSASGAVARGKGQMPYEHCRIRYEYTHPNSFTFVFRFSTSRTYWQVSDACALVKRIRAKCASGIRHCVMYCITQRFTFAGCRGLTGMRVASSIPRKWRHEIGENTFHRHQVSRWRSRGHCLELEVVLNVDELGDKTLSMYDPS